MRKYEVVHWDEHMDTSLADSLNNLAIRGWKLVTVLAKSQGFYTVIVEREVTDE